MKVIQKIRYELDDWMLMLLKLHFVNLSTW